MHSYLKSVGFSEITKRKQIKELVKDVIQSYDEKVTVENHEDGVFAQFSKHYGCDCGITVCGQYDENNEFHTEYYFPFFRGTGITTQESVVIEKHAEKEPGRRRYSPLSALGVDAGRGTLRPVEAV